MPLAQRRICALCGRAFAIVLPPGESELEERQAVPDVRDVAGAARGAGLMSRFGSQEVVGLTIARGALDHLDR